MPETLSSELRQAVVRDIAQLAAEKYVFPQVGQEIAQAIRAKLEEGRYDEISEASKLALALTEDLRSIAKDRHWSVIYDPQRLPENVDPETPHDTNRHFYILHEGRNILQLDSAFAQYRTQENRHCRVLGTAQLHLAREGLTTNNLEYRHLPFSRLYSIFEGTSFISMQDLFESRQNFKYLITFIPENRAAIDTGDAGPGPGIAEELVLAASG